MATEIKLPELGENVDSGDIVSVFVKEGDVIASGQAVVEIETGKAVLEVPTTVAGRVTKVHIAPGQAVKVGATLLSIEAAAGASAPPAKAPAPPPLQSKSPVAPPKASAPPPMPSKSAANPPAKSTAPPPMPASRPQPAAPAARAPALTDQVLEESNGHNHVAPPASPAVRRQARELGVDLARVQGTGEGGRITADDVLNAVRLATSAPSTATSGQAVSSISDGWGPVRREPLPKIRRTIAANMALSASTIPHVTNFDDADVTELEKMRKLSAQQYAESGIKLTMLAFVMKAVAHSLKHHPTLNASLDMESGEVIYKEYVNLGIAVDAPRGLIVPVMRNADKLSIPQIAQQISVLAEKAKNNQIAIDEMRGGTFTLSNMGAVGGAYSTPIINPPEVAILLVGRSKLKAVVLGDGTIAARLMLPLSLSYDHRLVDGAAAARFLNDVIGLLQVPGRLLLAP